MAVSWPQLVLFVGLLVYGALTFSALVSASLNGAVGLAILFTWMASALLLPFLRLVVEKWHFTFLVNPKDQSWAFLFGDTIFLPAAAAFMALAWSRIGVPNVITPGWIIWISSCVLLGLAAGVAFHWMDGKSYRAQGAGLALDSPTKWAHDFVAYPVLFGGLLCVGGPLLLKVAAGVWRALRDLPSGLDPAIVAWTLAAVVAVAAWGLMGFRDAKVGLDTQRLHPAWDTRKFETIPYPPKE